MSLRRRSLAASFAATIIALSRQVRGQELAYESFTVPAGNYPISLIGAQTTSHGFAGPWSVSDPTAAAGFALNGPESTPLVAGLLGSNASATAVPSDAIVSRNFDLSAAAISPYLTSDHLALGAPNTTLWFAVSVELAPDDMYGLFEPHDPVIRLNDQSSSQSPSTAVSLDLYSFRSGNLTTIAGHDLNYTPQYPQRGNADLYVFKFQYAQNSTLISAYLNPPPSSLNPNPTPDATVQILPGDISAPNGLLRFNSINWSPGNDLFPGIDTVASRISNLRLGATYADVAPSDWSLPITWKGDATGIYSDTNRWTGPIPSFGASGYYADSVSDSKGQPYFGPSSVPRTITLDSDIYVTKLVFDSNSPYTLTGPGVIRQSSKITGVPPDYTVTTLTTIDVRRGSHVIDATVTGSAPTDVSIAKGAFLSVKAINSDGYFADYTLRGGGTLNVQTVDTYLDFYHLRITDDSTLQIHIPPGAILASNPRYSLGNSNIDPGSQLLISAPGIPSTVSLVTQFYDGYNNTTFVNSGLIRLNPPDSPAPGRLAIQFQSAPNLNFNPASQAYTGTIDITSNALFCLNGEIPTLRSMIASAYASGTWTGTGITSSLAGPHGPTGAETLAVVSIRDFPALAPYVAPVWNGDPLDAAAVIYTYLGDTNLDGIVDVLDFANLRAGLASQGAFSGWSHGDFNYDGLIDQSDFALFQQGYASQSTPLGLAALIPEPSLSVFAFTPLFAPLRRATRSWAQQK